LGELLGHVKLTTGQGFPRLGLELIDLGLAVLVGLVGGEPEESAEEAEDEDKNQKVRYQLCSNFVV
jgi:hypothetical protein